MTDSDGGKTSSLFTDLKELREQIGGIRDDIRQATIQNASPISQATNTNHFGGIGVVVALIVATVCCTAMLTGGAVFAFMTSNQVAEQNAKLSALSAKIDKESSDTDAKLAGMQDYLNAIYVQAPNLRPKEKTQ